MIEWLTMIYFIDSLAWLAKLTLFQFQFGFNMFHEISRPFNMTYRCFSVSMLPGNERQDVERGGKSKPIFLKAALYSGAKNLC